MTRRILCVVGTRPEAIKMAPVIVALRGDPSLAVRVLATAQHPDLLDQALGHFDIAPDIDLEILPSNPALTRLAGRLLLELDHVLRTESPDVVLAQGDTTTVMAVALASFYHAIPFGHVGAGLRTWNLRDPFPEEMNRIVAGRLAKWHFAPTEVSRSNLMREGVPDADIVVTGNTVIDALLSVANRECALPARLDPAKRLILLTTHRSENFGAPLECVCRAVRTLLAGNPDVQVLYPVHPSPSVRDTANRLLGNLSRVVMCEPLGYPSFVAAMRRAYLILSDSGGVQEEAPALGKPLLVLRRATERPEAVQEGVAQLVGTDFNAIVSQAQRLLDDSTAYGAMARGHSPYGDGHAAARIARVVTTHLAACA